MLRADADQQRLRPATGTTVYSYDDAGNLTVVNYPGTVMDVTLQYDAHNRVTNMVDGIGTTTNSYWPGGRLKSESGPWTASTVSWGYTNTVPGLRTSLTLQQLSGPWICGSTYDAAGQLIRALGSGGYSTENLGYGYDASWNVTSRTNSGTPTAFTVNSENELTNGPDSACTWDANGRMLTSHGGTRVYTWDSEDRLSSLTHGTTWKSEFKYDGWSRLRPRIDLSDRLDLRVFRPHAAFQPVPPARLEGLSPSDSHVSRKHTVILIPLRGCPRAVGSPDSTLKSRLMRVR